MKVILRSDVRDLGRLGELVEVRPGYARNYLLPHDLAVPATKSNIRDWTKRIEVARAQEQQDRAAATEVANKLRDQRIFVIRQPAEGSTRLHGSVTTQDVAAIVNEVFDVQVDRRDVDLATSIRALGAFVARVKVFRGMTVPMRVQVVDHELTAEEIEELDRVVVEEVEEEVEEGDEATTEAGEEGAEEASTEETTDEPAEEATEEDAQEAETADEGEGGAEEAG